MCICDRAQTENKTRTRNQKQEKQTKSSIVFILVFIVANNKNTVIPVLGPLHSRRDRHFIDVTTIIQPATTTKICITHRFFSFILASIISFSRFVFALANFAMSIFVSVICCSNNR